MKWFVDLSTRAMVLDLSALILVPIVLVMVTTDTGLASIRQSRERLHGVAFADVRDLMPLRANQNRLRALTLDIQLLDKHPEDEI
jgi:hypothetical protein